MIDTITYAAYNEACTKFNIMLIRDTVFGALLMYNMKSTIARLFIFNNTYMFNKAYQNHIDLITLGNTLSVTSVSEFYHPLRQPFLIAFYRYFKCHARQCYESQLIGLCYTENRNVKSLFCSYYNRTFSSVNNYLHDIYLHPCAKM